MIKNSFFIFNSVRSLTFGGTETFLSPESHQDSNLESLDPIQKTVD